MRDVNGLSYAEISEALDMELGTVKSVFPGARRLANFLTEGPLSASACPTLPRPANTA
jgi:DNA-directed RNA polymerase specialized sigma24 family protein